MNVQHISFADDLDAEARAATLGAAIADVTGTLSRALAACAAGNVTEYALRLHLAADAAVLAGRLGATDAEICDAITAAQAGGAR
jgi:hypothetical protein